MSREVKIKPCTVSGSVRAPPSKSYTHRAIAIAALAEGVSEIRRPLISDDIMATIRAVRLFGAEVKEGGEEISVKGVQYPETPADVIDAMNSGTTLRIMTAIAGLAKRGYTVLTGDASLRRRPMQPLLDALRMLGIEAWSTRLNGCAPIIVKGGEMGGVCDIRGDVSSQFISGLLIAAPRASREVSVRVVGELVSEPYVEATMSVQRTFGVGVERSGKTFHVIPNGYRAATFTVPGDYGLAAFIMASPFMAGGEVEVSGLDPSMVQADYLIVDIIRLMGGEVEESGDRVKTRFSKLRGFEVDLRNSPDLLPIIACLGCVASGRTVIRGVRHARFKESDRIRALAEELSKLGVRVKELEDGLVIEGSRLKPATLNPRGDHRLFMCFAILALAVEGGLRILDPETASISYPSFLNDLRSIGVEVEV